MDVLRERLVPGPLGVNMSRVQNIRVFAGQRLHAALQDILQFCEKTFLKYEEEAALNREVIARQHALLCALHKPTADAFTQQQLLSNPEVPPQDQEDPDPPQADLDAADIIQYTYSCRTAAPPGEDGPAAGPEPEVTVVSSETEDSEDYGRDRSPPRVRRPAGAALSCRVCSRTFTARCFLSRHIKAHLKDAAPAGCGLCGQRFEDAQDLKRHIQTHRTPPGGGRTQQNQTRTRTRTRPDQDQDQDQTRTRTRPEPDQDQIQNKTRTRTRTRDRLAQQPNNKTHKDTV